MAIYFKVDWWLISGIESGISWVGNLSCPFPQRRCCRRIKKVLGNFSLRRFEFGFSTIEFGFLVFVKGKTHKIIFFFTHHGCKQVCLWSWLQRSSSPFLCLAMSLQLKTPPLCLAILPIPFSLSPQSVLSPAISSSLQILSDFANLRDKKGKRFSQSVLIQEAAGVYLFSLESTCSAREREICTAKALWRMHAQGGSVLLFVPWSNSSLQGKEETDAQQKHFGRCMHKECFLICLLKRFFSKGKKKMIAQQKHFGNACTRRECFPIVPWSTSSPRERRKRCTQKHFGGRRSFPIVHCSISMREERKKDEPK